MQRVAAPFLVCTVKHLLFGSSAPAAADCAAPDAGVDAVGPGTRGCAGGNLSAGVMFALPLTSPAEVRPIWLHSWPE